MHTSFPMPLYLIFAYSNWHQTLGFLLKLEAMFLINHGKSSGPWTSLLLNSSLPFFFPVFGLCYPDTVREKAGSGIAHHSLCGPDHPTLRGEETIPSGPEKRHPCPSFILVHVIFLAMENDHWVEACSPLAKVSLVLVWYLQLFFKKYSLMFSDCGCESSLRFSSLPSFFLSFTEFWRANNKV